MQKLTIHNETIRNRAIEIIRNLSLDPIMEIIIKEHKKDRSAEQHRLYFMWVEDFAKYMGETKEQIHFDFKKDILLPIYAKDETTGVAEKLGKINNLIEQGLIEDAKFWYKETINGISTTTAKVRQFQQLLDEISHKAISIGLVLRYPDDLYQ